MVLKEELKIYSVICCHCVGSVKYKAKWYIYMQQTPKQNVKRLINLKRNVKRIYSTGKIREIQNENQWTPSLVLQHKSSYHRRLSITNLIKSNVVIMKMLFNHSIVKCCRRMYKLVIIFNLIQHNWTLLARLNSKIQSLKNMNKYKLDSTRKETNGVWSTTSTEPYRRSCCSFVSHIKLN